MSVGAAELGFSVAYQRRADRRRWRLLYAQLVLLALVFAALAYSTAREPFSIALLALIMIWAAVIVRPIFGLYAAVLLTMVGDTVTVPWYPYTKNLSSRESILFVADQISVNPLEITIMFTALSWIVRRLGDATWELKRGAMLRPVLVFGGFVVLGMAYGLSRGGHDTTVAVWEARPLVYVPIVYLLVTNLLTTGRQYERLFICALVGIVAQSILSLQYFHSLDPEIRENLDSLTEHAASIHVGALVIFVLAIWLLPGTRSGRRIWLTAALIPCLWMFVLSQRRAAAIALIIGILLLAALIYQHRRWAAIWFALIAIVVGVLYTAAFWNSSDSIGFGAEAVKSVIAPGQRTQADLNSDLYRQIEAFDIWYTIRYNELFGVGFGQQFLRPATLPDISFFVFWQYIPHNTILWIWMKMGVGGFMAMLYLVARTIHRGVRAVAKIDSPDLTSVAIGAVAYVVMYIVYCYVDIGWDIRSTVLLAVAIAICGDLERIVAEPGADDETDDSLAEPSDHLELVS